jgi:enamine deaminase RidA (YjgF/YER057c/UK114 family)
MKLQAHPVLFAVSIATMIFAFGTASAQSPTAAEARMKEKNIVLPATPVPSANYVPAVRVGNLLFLSGVTSRELEPKGKVGKDLTVEQGYQAARHAGLLLLANAKGALGSLDRVKRVVKVFGMVNSADGFGDQPRVINGFSDLIVEVFGEAVGKHARSAVGMAALPGNAPVEVEAILEVE